MAIPPEPARCSRLARPTTLLAVALAAAAVLGACGTTGRTLHPPPPGATAPTTASTFAPATSQAAINTAPTTAGFFVLSSAAFSPGGTLPTPYTCDGAGNPPPLTWSDIPKGTVELVHALSDPDAGGYVHWLVAGIRRPRSGWPAASSPRARSCWPTARAPTPTRLRVRRRVIRTATSSRSTREVQAVRLTTSSDAKTAIAKFDNLTPGPAVLTADYSRP